MVLIIGVGNTLRRDDGVGPLLAERLAADIAARGIPVEWIATQQLTPDFAEVIDETAPAAVFFVDADASCTETKITHVTDNGDSSTGSHALGPSMLLYLARQLYGWKGSAWLVQVPASDFEHGEGLSPPTQKGLDQSSALSEQIAGILDSR
jgi:hydrogenase maturation protease